MNLRKKHAIAILSVIHYVPAAARTPKVNKAIAKLREKVGPDADYPSSRTGKPATRSASSPRSRTRTPRGVKALGGPSSVGARGTRGAKKSITT